MQKTILIVIILVILIAIILGIYFLVSNSKTSQSANFEIQGMKVAILTQGIGAEAKAGDNVTVHYTGTLENGTKFDSSIDRNAPFTFPLGQDRVIKGFDLGIVGMKVGEKRRLTISPELGYGASGVGGVIPPNSTLIYEVELLRIN